MIPLTADEYRKLATLAERDGDGDLAAKLREGLRREGGRAYVAELAPIRAEAIAKGLAS